MQSRTSFVTPQCCLPRALTSNKHQTCQSSSRLTPILVADVLDTLVVDPFFNGMHTYFGFKSFDSFVAAKTPHLWVQFEKGQVGEPQVIQNFFKDKRPVDLNNFKRYLRSSYRLMPGTAHMLNTLRDARVEVHLCSNYPTWASMIEEELQLSSIFGVHWTFISGHEGVRKPEKLAFLRVAEKAKVAPDACVLLDDNLQNCHGAMDAGFLAAVHFQNATQAEEHLEEIFKRHGVTINF